MKSRQLSLLLVVTAVCLVTLPGCIGALAQLMYTIKGTQIDPAFKGLNGKRVAVVCVSDSSAYGPDTLTHTVARDVGIKLTNGLEEGSRVIAPSEIEQWIDENDWTETEYVELGKGVDADLVVAIEIGSYSLTEGSTLLKGKADVMVTVYDVENDGQIPYSATPKRFVYPRNARPAIQTSERQFESFYLAQLTTMIANQFIAHDRLANFANDAATLR